MQVTLANGHERCFDIRVFSAEVQLGKRTIIDYYSIDIPLAADNMTLLGIDALEDLGIIINTPQWVWKYMEKPDRLYHNEAPRARLNPPPAGPCPSN